MSWYLKYYFGHDGNRLFLDSVACAEGDTPVEPDNFLKWYEEGDFAPQSFTEKEKAVIAKSESPVFASMFIPRTVTFSVDELLTRCKNVNKYVEVYGEQYRRLITDSLAWLDGKEPAWGVSFDRDAFIDDLVKNALVDVNFSNKKYTDF